MRTKRDLFGYLSFKAIAALSYLLALGYIAKKRVFSDSKKHYSHQHSKSHN